MDTCNLLLNRAMAVFAGAGGINERLAAMSLDPPLSPITTILKLSAAIDTYEKTTAVRYPVATIRCERLRNTQTEKFRLLSGSASFAVEVRVSGARAEDLDTQLNSYVEAACQVLQASRGPWSDLGMYDGTYDVKFQAARPGGKQFTKSAHIEFDIRVSK